MPKNRWRGLLLSAVLVASILACGYGDEVQDKADMVDEAVSLLQDIEDNSAWSYFADGLDELENQEQGFVLAVSRRESQGEDPSASPEQSITIQVDAEGDALAEITDNAQTSTYFIESYRAGGHAPVYRVESGRYICAQQEDAGRLFQLGLDGLFETYPVDSTGVRLLAVVERDEDGDETLAGRDAVRYRVKSRVEDAREILKRLDNETLHAAVDAAGTLDFSGALYLDEETLALLRYESDYIDTATQHRTEFVFEVTAWDEVNDIPDPGLSLIDVPCD